MPDLLNFGNSQDSGIQLFQKIYGNSPTGYRGTFNQAYTNLGQPAQGHDEVAANGVLGLAKPFIDAYQKKNNKLPSEDEVRNFVANNLNSSYASKVITGQINPDQVMTQYVNPALEQTNQRQTQGNEQINQGIAGLNDLNTQVYNAAKEQLPRDIEELYTPQKKSLVEDLAAQNQLGQANSRYSLDALEAQKQKSLVNALGNINVARAQGGLDIGKTAQNLLANERQLQQQNQQFGQNFGLERQRLNNAIDQQEYQRGLDQQKLSLASQLGKYQAEGQSDNGIGGGLGGALSGGLLGSKFGPWGTLAGGLGGGLLGYFGTKR